MTAVTVRYSFWQDLRLGLNVSGGRRIKDLADIARLVEAYSFLRALLYQNLHEQF